MVAQDFIVACHHCGAEATRSSAKAVGWIRSQTGEGWICVAHPPLAPIDWTAAGCLAHDASRELEQAMEKLFALDANALENLDEAQAILDELRETTAKLRAGRRAA